MSWLRMYFEYKQFYAVLLYWLKYFVYVACCFTFAQIFSNGFGDLKWMTSKMLQVYDDQVEVRSEYFLVWVRRDMRNFSSIFWEVELIFQFISTEQLNNYSFRMINFHLEWDWNYIIIYQKCSYFLFSYWYFSQVFFILFFIDNRFLLSAELFHCLISLYCVKIGKKICPSF